MLFFEDVLVLDELLHYTLHCDNVYAINLLVDLLEISIEILRLQVYPQDSGSIDELQAIHEEKWSLLLCLLHERDVLEAIEEVMAVCDNDDSADETECEVD
jgi:hypothetical protein